ncbi:type I restriction-modification system subunit S [Iodidimonas muriae]|uniref:Type I restriction-modification system subunit S n=1 Tax=Iodidimonas muriae TaxID=261467 RepID=A0ABQ2LHA3_9PROT|nr:restriction endonuclease subunit S [Iodidimonas muriae]GER08692.1 type I restriction-modification system subunit S [Kordiimonadales bacterium JCM 17843]GGO17194.1 type I restriction-modification system subunit S [Iodidimonas muriae]
MGEWRATKWGDEISLEYGKAIRGYQNVVAPYPVYGTNGPVGFTDTPLAPGPGVILGRKGAYRGVHYSPDPFFVIDTAYYVKPKMADLNMRWLYYAIIYHKLGEIDDGSPIPSTTRAAVYVRDLEVPPIEEQEAIASVLGFFDDKIELNRRMNETLEAMARAIFKDWFVDFGPTRAKAEGRPPYLAPEIWDLFPAALDDEDKPVGWETQTLDTIVSLTKGRSYKSAELQDATVALVTLKSFQRGGGYRRDGLKPYTGKFKLEQVVSPGELVIALTDVTQAAEVIGKPAIVLEDARYEALVASLDVGIVRPRGKRIGRSFIAQMLLTEQFQNHAYSHSTGTTVLHLSKEAVPTFQACLPPVEIAALFEEAVEPISMRIAANAHESDVLAQTRDLLLPKLMSGEIRLAEAEKAVEAVA